MYSGAGSFAHRNETENHGRVGYKDGVRWDYPNNLAGDLSNAGYYTQAVGKMHVHPLRNNFGFHNVELHDGYLGHYRNNNRPYYEHQNVADDYFYWLKNTKGVSTDIIDTGLECNSWAARPWQHEEELHPTNWVVSRSIDFLRRRDRDKPFFLFASFVRPHPPFDAPQCYFDMYNRAGIEFTPPPIGDWADTYSYKTLGRHHSGEYITPDDELLRQAQAGYYACITHLDHQIGRLMQSLAEDNALNDTFIIFTSDHGELLGDHHLFRKVLPYQGSVNIPLIVKPNAGFNIQRGTSSKNVTELMDIMPTLLDVAGAKIPETVDGVSLTNCICGDGETREYLHGEHSWGGRSNHYVVTEKDKYIWFSQTGQEQYFDLADDPTELHDKINYSDSQTQNRIIELRNFLIEELNGRAEGYSDGEKLITGKQTLTNL